MKSFFTDSDGFSIQDLEKLTLNIVFALSVFAILYKFVSKDLSDMIIVQYSLGIGSLMVFRKLGSYYVKTKQMNNIVENNESDNSNNNQSIN